MTSASIAEPKAAAAASAAPEPAGLSRPSARSRETVWPATTHGRERVWARLTCAPFAVPDNPGSRHRRSHEVGLGLLLDWLADQPGQTWQQRWLASGADTDGGSWRRVPGAWLADRGHHVQWRHDALFRAFLLAVSADLIRPSLGWLVAAAFRRGSLVNVLARHRDVAGFARLRGLCDEDPDVSAAAATRTAYRAGMILAAKGGTIDDITTGDVLELLTVEAAVRGTSVGATHLFYRILHTMGVFGANAPATLRELRTTGQRTCDEMIDRYGLVCRPIRDLLVDYLRERQPALDYTSLDRSRTSWAACSGPISSVTIQASTACVCQPRSPTRGNSGCVP